MLDETYAALAAMVRFSLAVASKLARPFHRSATLGSMIPSWESKDPVTK